MAFFTFETKKGWSFPIIDMGIWKLIEKKFIFLIFLFLLHFSFLFKKFQIKTILHVFVLYWSWRGGNNLLMRFRRFRMQDGRNIYLRWVWWQIVQVKVAEIPWSIPTYVSSSYSVLCINQLCYKSYNTTFQKKRKTIKLK